MAPPQKMNGRPRRRRSMESRSSVDRSAYFARREAAHVLRAALEGDARRHAAGSIKSLVYSPSVRNKRATFALVCQTLKHLPLLKDVLAATNILNSKWRKQEELVYVTVYDILFGQEIAMSGPVERFLMLHKNELESALAKLYVKEKAKSLEDLLLNYQPPAPSKPRYVRVNTLKMDVDSAIQELGKANRVIKDDMVPDMLVLPSGTDLHDHPLVVNGNVFLQGKASSMVAVALCPKPGWKVLDACAAPGNKTVHLAALMRGKGDIIACELHKERFRVLEDTIRRSGAHNVHIINGDFLDLDVRDPLLSEVRAILLDPSCSGSGISAERLDHLLPSYAKDSDADAAQSERVRKLAAFQRKALAHALSFSAVERVVYSTCSIHQAENEDVIKSVLPLATSLNFELATPFPQWSRRGLPVFEGSVHLLRTDPVEDMEGFFIALFVRKQPIYEPQRQTNQGEVSSSSEKVKIMRKQSRQLLVPSNKVSMMWFYSSMKKRTSNKKAKSMSKSQIIL